MGFNLFSNSICVTQQQRNAVKYRLSHHEASRTKRLQCPVVRPARHACVLSPFSRRRNESSSPRERESWPPFPSRSNSEKRSCQINARVSLGALMGRSAAGEIVCFSIPPVDGRHGRSRIEVAAVRKSTVTGKTMTGPLTRLQRGDTTRTRSLSLSLSLSYTNLPV